MNEKGKNKILSLVAVFILVLLSGCGNERIIDKIQITDTLAYDKKKDKIEGMVIYPLFTEKGKTVLKDFKTVSGTFEDTLPRLDTKAAYPIEIGKLDMVVLVRSLQKEESLKF
ncbi:hypothetical protein [Peribacillus kribbensis]|uniref:hypothetical protein n=1 Tax=Peribacillus kribbensis TaxID=356658 RepID=UPI000421B998|nr:hypothetical protein [Peribacillus kribbensis]